MSAPSCPNDQISLIQRMDQGPLTQGLRLLPIHMDSPRARAQLLKIGLQESRLEYRDQITAGKQFLGPALGLLQFEQGGVKGLMRHKATRDHLRSICRARGIEYATKAIWKRLKSDDAFAFAVGRLNLYWHAEAIPAVSDEEGSWDYYIWCWRPGKPHRDAWVANHERVVEYFNSSL